MTKFKIGDKVVRVGCSFNGIMKGDICTVESITDCDGFLNLKESPDKNYCFHSEGFELHQQKYHDKPHIHAECIKAWADGARIEGLIKGEWYYMPSPNWYTDSEYRIKLEDNAKQEKITNIRQKMEKLTKELKELEDE